jgi:hypothetical protein
VIDALIAGRLHGTPTARTAANGNGFATCKVRVATREGTTFFANVIAFEPAAVAALLALADGDSAALAGELSPKVYTPASGEPKVVLDLLAHVVITAYHVSRKRQAVAAEVEA